MSCPNCQKAFDGIDAAVARVRALYVEAVASTVVMPALDDLMRRRMHAPVHTVAIDLRRDSEHHEWCDAECEARGCVYEYATTVGALSALGLALGSLAPLAALLGGA